LTTSETIICSGTNMNSVALQMLRLSLVLFVAGLAFGVVAAFVFLDDGTYKSIMPFQELRPIHVSAAVFWILTSSIGGLLFYVNGDSKQRKYDGLLLKIAFTLWLLAIVSIITNLACGNFGGRKYWEFPPILAVPVLLSWMLFAAVYFGRILSAHGKKAPVYVWMWSTGMIFFLITFTEANLWLIPWFRENIVRDITVQWKANGAIVGAWNQIVYGTAIYLMTKIEGDDRIAFKWQSFFFYFLGLTNLMFNWGHHIYNIPAAPWIRDISYAISMTEWVLLINIMRSFKSKLGEAQRLANILPYRFLLASEIWVFLNLVLAILISIPAVNIFTHGTHVTVAHAMGTSIGINTMILFASLAYILEIRNPKLLAGNATLITGLLCAAHMALLVFWIALITAGVTKGYQIVLNHLPFEMVMAMIRGELYVFSFSGVIVALALGAISFLFLRLFFLDSQKTREALGVKFHSRKLFPRRSVTPS